MAIPGSILDAAHDAPYGGIDSGEGAGTGTGTRGSGGKTMSAMEREREDFSRRLRRIRREGLRAEAATGLWTAALWRTTRSDRRRHRGRDGPARSGEGGAEVRSIHWSPYDPVGDVDADP